MATPNQMRSELDNLQREVTETTDVMAAAEKIIAGFGQMLRDTKGDPAAVRALADQLDKQQQSLAQAIVANTPAEEGSGSGSSSGGGSTGTEGSAAG